MLFDFIEGCIGVMLYKLIEFLDISASEVKLEDVNNKSVLTLKLNSLGE
jgi:hypothetical protein